MTFMTEGKCVIITHLGGLGVLCSYTYASRALANAKPIIAMSVTKRTS